MISRTIIKVIWRRKVAQQGIFVEGERRTEITLSRSGLLTLEVKVFINFYT